MMQVSYGPEFFPVVPFDLNKVVALQEELLKMPQPDIVTTHSFPDGKYERTIVIPPWVVLTGAAHKTPYRVRLEKGFIAVNTDSGVQVFTAPCEFDAPAGVQRAGRVFSEEVIWVDIYDNLDKCTDLAILEDRLYVVPECGLAASRTEAQKARIDYNAFLAQMGMTYEQVHSITSIETDLIDMPNGISTELRDSPIHGQGLFATQVFRLGDMVCPGRLNDKRTPGGRFINHSANSNIIPVKIGDDIYAQATRDIMVGDELLVDYRDSVRVNFGITLQGEVL